MDERRLDPGGLRPLRVAREHLRIVVREAPGARALRRRAGRRRRRSPAPARRSLDAAPDVAAEEHAPTIRAWPTSAPAWLRAPPASSTSAASARSSSTGSSPASAAASSCCGSRTPTRAARSPRPPSRSSASCAGSGIDWDGDGHVPARQDGRLPRSSPAAGRRGQGVRGRGRDPVPHARRGDDRLGRPDPRPDRVPEREARGRRARPLRRPADVQLRLSRGRHARRDHACDPRPGPRLEHAEADPDPARPRRGAPGLRACAGRARHRRQEALEAPRRAVGRRLPRAGLHPRGARQLPRPPRLVVRRQDGSVLTRRAAQRCSSSSASARARPCSTTRSSPG